VCFLYLEGDFYMTTQTGIIGVQDYINLTTDQLVDSVFLQAADGDWVTLNATTGGTVTFQSQGASADSTKSRVGILATSDADVVINAGAGNFGIRTTGGNDRFSFGNGQVGVDQTGKYDVLTGAGNDLVTLGTAGGPGTQYSVFFRDFDGISDKWGFRASPGAGVDNAVIVSNTVFGVGNFEGINTITATFGGDVFHFNSASTTLAAVQAAFINPTL
jgi:hypothetical protein